MSLREPHVGNEDAVVTTGHSSMQLQLPAETDTMAPEFAAKLPFSFVCTGW
jgi:hypothetical protein